MKIALIHTPLTHSTGGERQILQLAIELSKKGHKVEIFTNYVDQQNCFPELLSKVKVNAIPPNPVSFLRIIVSLAYHIGMIKTLRELAILSIAKAIPHNEFDIINCHNLSTNWAAWLAKKRLKIPVVWMCNEPPFWHFLSQEKKKKTFIIDFLFFNVFDKYTVRFVDEIVVLSKKFQNIVKKIYGRNSTIIRSGVDINFFEKGNGEKIRKELGLENSFILLQVGSAMSYKIDFNSILALSYLHKEYEQLRLIFIGYGVKEFFGSEVYRLGLDKKVFFFSNIDDKKLSDFYASCDVFLFPANQSWGLVVVEAMAASKTVIVSEKAGVSEIIQNGINGIVVEHGQPEKITYHVEKLINNPRLCRDIGENAHEFVKKNFSWEKYANEMLEIFEKTLQEREIIKSADALCNSR